ncbi:Mth938-like domain-containing protein [Paracoccus sp. 1_MG-2023]|uniref:Mth938-like domain-containing protein n=1 Tax=unclassified Paracoccus (in: a-proteobacteria) TaxID=2688777 RepID=UPI001C08152A|nr:MULTISPECIES: Mth938-like domain-containing protein [unclassified Paracoccus (in: a-proteobacteria)]MBU2959007.1 Mth938-like domain-containing protein [Paracoccus sp. C2R09]MDO6668979.1 Mth938-like domain-containing protein [Paracoccus sp. 1_MG-2023]
MLSPTEFDGQNAVDGYGPGFFRVAGKVHHGAIVVEGDRISGWGGLDDRATLRGLAGRVDVLFLGMGAEIAYAPRDLVEDLKALDIRVEAMASATAARTYNVTLSEGRRVACALLPL